MKSRKLHTRLDLPFTPIAEVEQIQKSAPRIVSFGPGTTWSIAGDRVSILHHVSVNEVVVRRFGSEQVEKVDISRLEPVKPSSGEVSSAAPPLDIQDHSPDVWERAIREEAQVKAWLSAGGCTPASRAVLAAQIGISDRQLRRHLQMYADLQTVAAFLPRRSGALPGSTRLNSGLEVLIREQIEQALKNSPDIAVDDIYLMLVSTAKAMRLKPPGRSTVARRLAAARRQTELLPPSIGDALRYRNKQVLGEHGAEGPLHIAEMDHTIVDAHLIEPETRRPIGRPVLSILIDRKTRVILGILLSLEAPSRLSVGLCLHHAVMPKTAWLRELGLDTACWPGFGLVHTLYTDNAREFQAMSLRRACQIYGIAQAFRPPGDPAAGGIVERAIGTLMTKARLLPGSSYSNLLGQKPRHAHRGARFTLAELTEYVARQISIYHKSTHSGIGMAPLTAWEKGWLVNRQQGSPRIPDDGHKFLISFLPGTLRVVTPAGVQIFSLQFQSTQLELLKRDGRQYMVRYDPRDLSRVFVEVEGAHIVASRVSKPGPAFSLWEWRERRAVQIQEGRPRDPEEIAAELRANRALIDSKAVSGTRLTNARRKARQDEWAKVHRAEEELREVENPLPIERTDCQVRGDL